MKTKEQKDLPACVKCKYYRLPLTGYPVCTRKAVLEKNIIDGYYYWHGQETCWSERGSWFPKLMKKCGKEGRFFELKSDE